MKRSEMVTLIENEIREFYNDYGDFYDLCAKIVLDRIEKVGMLPPKTPIIVDTGEVEVDDNLKTTRVLKLEYATMWEPEDE